MPDYVDEAKVAAGGHKADDGKPRFDLIPPEAMIALADLYRIGAEKYADRNWERGMTWGRMFRAMMSHAWKWWMGEEHDPVDGQHHLTSVAWCAIALYTWHVRGVGSDDRVKSVDSSQGYSIEDEAKAFLRSRSGIQLGPSAEGREQVFEGSSPTGPTFDVGGFNYGRPSKADRPAPAG